MNKAEIVALVTMATASCPSAQEKDPGPIVMAWQLMLGDIPFAVAKAAVVKVCRSSRFFPSIAEIVEAAQELDPRNEKLPTAADAWAEVNRQICEAGIYKVPTWSCELVQKAARAIGWRQLCCSENPEADRAHFLRIYESMRNNVRDNRENAKALELSGMCEALKALAGNIGQIEGPK